MQSLTGRQVGTEAKPGNKVYRPPTLLPLGQVQDFVLKLGGSDDDEEGAVSGPV